MDHCTWRNLFWILGSLLIQAQFSHQQRISGPNVCKSGRRSECCPGWELQPRLQKCVVPICSEDCGDGFCLKPNVCSCPNGELSISGCGTGRTDIIPGSMETRWSPYGDMCDPACGNGGRCGREGRCTCPFGFLGRTCQIDYRTGPCFSNGFKGECSEQVPGLHSTKILCCATVGQAWGTSCEPCNGMVCPKGYMRHMRTGECIDIDECLLIPDICGDGTCTNLLGTFICEETGTPLVQNATSQEDGATTGPCFTYENNGACSFPVNYVGSELLVTKELCCSTIGQGWGESCEPCADFSSQCVPGFRLQPNGRCFDINECNEIPGICQRGRCYNVEGSFRCEAKGVPVEVDIKDDRGQCFTYENRGLCSLEVPDLYTSKELCCATIGKSWGTQDSCESCSEFSSGCESGFMATQRGCADINECEMIPEVCRNGTCQNTYGGFQCQAVGVPLSARDSDSGLCFTRESNGACSEEIPYFYTSKELCCHTVGQAWGDEELCESCTDIDISCAKGYRPTEGTTNCIDINECKEMPGVCGPAGWCTNIEGSFRCQSTGQRRDTGLCFTSAVNGACSVGSLYTSKQLCCATFGQGWGSQYSCEMCSDVQLQCDKGYKYDDSTRNCVDINECEEMPGLCGPAGWCTNIEGFFRCQSTGSSRSDQNQGNGGLGPCYTYERSGTCSFPVDGVVTTKAECCATVGKGWGEQCESCADHASRCVPGFILQNGRCFDIDECELMPNICNGGTCQNLEGSFRCQATGTPLSSAPTGQCFTKYGDGLCAEEVSRDFYTTKELCCLTLGIGWGAWDSCESCSDIEFHCGRGYMYEEGTTNCVDINECEQMPGLCGPKGWCSNLPGYFRCQSIPKPIESTDSQGPCFTYATNDTCSFPVDGLVTTKEICCATVGRGWGEACESCADYDSRCVPGLILQSDGSCADVNECELMPTLCQEGTCSNMEGSFRCQATGTPLSAGGQADSQGEATGQCYTYENNAVCSFPISSRITQELCCATAGKAWGESCESCADFDLKCQAGYLRNEQGKCTDVNECDEISGLCQDGVCENLAGGFKCQAKGKPRPPAQIGAGGAQDTGLCFTFEASGSCSLEVPGLRTSKAVCCSTIGTAWGTPKDCELCEDFKSPCQTGFVEDRGKCFDVNECDMIPGICSTGTCQNTEGAFVCEAKGKPLSSNTTSTDAANNETDEEINAGNGAFEVLDEGSSVGIENIRLMQVTTDGSVQVYDVDVTLKILEDSSGDVITTDEIKNEIYNQARGSEISSSEEFGQDVCQSLLDTFKQADGCKVTVYEGPLTPMSEPGQQQNAFLHAHDAVKFSEVVQQRDETAKVYGGLDYLEILKTSQSDSVNLALDGLLALPEDVDEVTSLTEIWCKWLYNSPEGKDFDRTWDVVRNTTFDIFKGVVDTSALPSSVQSTADLLGYQVLQQIPEVDQVEVKMPTTHYYPISKEKSVSSKVFVSSQSSGVLQAVVRRQQDSPPP